MAELSEWLTIKKKAITLFVINVFQPVTVETIHRKLQDEVSLPELQDLLFELNHEGKITEENKHYRLTSIGTKSIIPGKGRTMRDIHRMEYLIEYSKQRGVDS